MSSIFETDPVTPSVAMPVELSAEERKDEFKKFVYLEDYKEARKNGKKIMSGNTKKFQCIIG